MRSINNSIGSEMIPVRLIISVSIIAIISLFTVQGFTQYTQIRQEESFVESLTILQKNIEAMVLSGQPRDITNINSPKGTTQVHRLFIPSVIQELTFGSTLLSTMKHDVSCQSNRITFSSQHSGKQVLWCDEHCSFVKGVYNKTTDIWIPDNSFSSFHISCTGTLMLSFELITDGPNLFVLVYNQNE